MRQKNRDVLLLGFICLGSAMLLVFFLIRWGMI
jgi:hypothetical protein